MQAGTVNRDVAGKIEEIGGRRRGSHETEETEVREVQKSRFDIVAEGTQERVQVSGVHVPKVLADSRETESHGGAGKSWRNVGKKIRTI